MLSEAVGGRGMVNRRPGMRSWRWWLVCAVGAGLCVAGCTGAGTGAATPPPPVTPGTPFDPPSSFDLEQAVDLDTEQAMNGTLHGTVLYSVVGGAFQATDLLDATQSWSVDLNVGADEICELEPVVLDGTVLV
ncbi:MAG: hypothetical protein FWE61_07000, partial [Micrococcales bacterium]|nr:hypothetical protein [Micrococcales bacterium]